MTFDTNVHVLICLQYDMFFVKICFLSNVIKFHITSFITIYQSGYFLLGLFICQQY